MWSPDPPKSHINPMDSSLKKTATNLYLQSSQSPPSLRSYAKFDNSEKAPVYLSTGTRDYLIQIFHKYLLSLYYVPVTKYYKYNDEQRFCLWLQRI